MTLEQKIAKAKAAGYSEAEIQGFLSKRPQSPGIPEQPATTGNPGNTQEPGLIKKGWDALNKPAEMSRDGLNQMMELHTQAQNAIAAKTGLPIGTEPTGNMARDVAANTPRIIGESVAEVAPSFIDRTSILTAGAGMALKGAGKVAGAALPKVAPMLEAGSGLQKGTLNAAFKDPGMIADFGGKLKASQLYNEIKEGASVAPRLRTNAKIASNAISEMAKGNPLPAPDAFKARKAVRALMKSKQYPMDDLLEAEKGLTEMVVSSANKADQMYVRAIRGEQMRNVSRLNKNGTTGPISAAIMAKIPMLAPFLSPAVQGGAASAAGAAAQMPAIAPLRTGAMVSAGLDRLAGKKQKEKRYGKRD
jgi:hypothetical protein